jgi:hypothetical protein
VLQQEASRAGSSILKQAIDESINQLLLRL